VTQRDEDSGPVFALKNIKYAYGQVTVLDVPEWRAAQGEHWLLVGASGSGKTTLLHILAGILTLAEGEATVAGEALTTLTPSQRDKFRGRHIGIVFQKLHLVQSLTVLGNLLLAQYLAGMPHDEQLAVKLLESVGLDDKASAYPHTLSEGQAQRVAVVRAVINHPQLLLADEPTANLDDENCGQALDLLESQAGSCNATLVIATHDMRTRARFNRQYELTKPR
jgi:putative ABC transport system ATP-binding protein